MTHFDLQHPKIDLQTKLLTVKNPKIDLNTQILTHLTFTPKKNRPSNLNVNIKKPKKKDLITKMLTQTSPIVHHKESTAESNC